MDTRSEFFAVALKDSVFNSELITYLWVMGVSIWGGLVSFFNKGGPFSWRKLFMHLSSSSFAGLMTFFLCQEANISGPLTGVFCGVAAHMGTSALVNLLMKSKTLKAFFDTGTGAGPQGGTEEKKD